MSDVCPACKSIPLTQQKDRRTFVCSNPRCPVKYFSLINRSDLKEKEEVKGIRKCANCGVWAKELEPSGLCKKCVKELAEREVR